MQRKNKNGGDLDWFYNDEKRPDRLTYDPKKKYRQTFREKYLNKQRKQFAVGTIFQSAGFWIVVAIAILAIAVTYVPKQYEVINSFADIASPSILKAQGSTTKKVGGKEFKIDYLNKCTVRGLVTDTQGYMGFNVSNRLSPLDVGISWGKLPSQNDNMSWSSPGNRFLYYRYTDSVLKELGSVENIMNHFSNYHLIASDYHSLKLMNRISQGDYVKIEGYLVRVTNGAGVVFNSNGGKSFDMESVRGDTLYVTNVTWLKKGGEK